MDNITYLKRKREFNELRDLALDAPIIYECIEMYARGVCVTKEEALLQMVRNLAESDKRQRDLMVDTYMRHGLPFISQPGPYKEQDPCRK